MKKNYIRPASKVMPIELNAVLMSGSLLNGGDYTGGSASGQANGFRRNTWSNDWGED